MSDTTIPENYTEQNRRAWNEAAPHHRRARGEDLRKTLSAPDFCAIEPESVEAFQQIGLAGKRVAHLCCNNGIELISLVKKGAASGVGFDISDAFITEANELATLSQTNCHFVRTDVLAIPALYDASFDIVYFSIGGLTWFHDLSPVMAVARRLALEGATLVLHDMHPFSEVIAATGDDDLDSTDPLRIVRSYFDETPRRDTYGLDYLGHTPYEGEIAISFAHRMEAILQAVIDAGFRITRFREYRNDISNIFADAEKAGKLPLSYILTADAMP